MQEGTVGGGCGITVPIEKMQVIRVWHREKHTGFETIKIMVLVQIQVMLKEEKRLLYMECSDM